MKRKFLVVPALLLFFGLNVFCQTNSQQNIITVAGKATIYVDPDSVSICVSVESRNQDVLKARMDTEAAAKKVITSAQSFGIPAKDVRTDYIDIDPYYDKGLVPKYYDASIDISMILHDLTKFDNLITGLLKAGAKRIKSISFSNSDHRKYADKARAEAINAAHEKAVAMAAVLYRTVGEAVTIYEQVSEYYSSYSNFSNAIEEEPGSGRTVFKQMAISAKVTVSFRLK